MRHPVSCYVFLPLCSPQSLIPKRNSFPVQENMRHIVGHKAVELILKVLFLDASHRTFTLR